MKRCSIALAVSLLWLQALLAQTTIVMTGDILLDRGVRKQIEYNGKKQLIPDETAEIFRSADIVVGNLECPVTRLRHPVFKRFVFRAEPEWLEILKESGFTHLNLANNHSLDQDRDGLMDTRRNIEQAGMTAVGAGENLQEAVKPVLLCRQPRPVYLMASNCLPLENLAWLPEKPCVSQEPFDTLVARVRNLRETDSTCVIIVSLHWGWEHQLSPTASQRLQARALIDAGADALICHHTHTLQTIEEYKGHPIYYSIGNFIFDQAKPLNSRAAIVRLRIHANSIETETIPITIRNCRPLISQFGFES